MRLLVSLCLLWGVASCGSRKPMDDKGDVIFWQISTSAANFTSCSDDPNFEGFFDPSSSTADSFFQQFQPGNTFAYRLSQDGTTATAQNCSSLDSSTCSDNPTFVFQSAGNDLILGQDQIISFQNVSDCAIDDALDWDVTDQGQTMTMSVDNTLSLIGDAGTCAQIEASQKSQSPNGKGYQGCIISISASTTLEAVGG
jgi:hypothetical protein